MKNFCFYAVAGVLLSGPAAAQPMVSAALEGGVIETQSSGGYHKDALFEAGSIGKFACTIATLRLIDRGAFELDDAVGQLVPALAGTPISTVTLKQLLENRSGLADGLLPAFSEDPRAVMQTADALTAAQSFAAGELAFEPGSKWSYDLVNWIVVQAVLEAQTGKPVSQVLDETVLNPAGMSQSHIFRVSIGDGAQEPAEPVRPLPEFLSCAGTLATTARDLIALVRFPHQGGLSPESLSALQTVATPEEGYTLGGRYQTVSGRWLSWQSGSNGAYRSIATYDPLTDTGFAAMTATGESDHIRQARADWVEGRLELVP